MSLHSAAGPWSNPPKTRTTENGVPALDEILAQLRRDEQREREEVANERWYKVVHDRVAIRAFASTSAPMVGARRRGDVVRAVQVDGDWARLHPEECAGAFQVNGEDRREWKLSGAREGWMLVDGGSVGLNKLMEEIEAPKDRANVINTVPQRKPKTLTREEFEVARCLALGMVSITDVPRELRDVRELAMEAVRSDRAALQHLGPELRGDKELVLHAVMRDAGALRYASPELQNDFEVVFQAAQRDGRMTIHASEELQRDSAILAAAKEAGQKASGAPRGVFSARVKAAN